MKLFVVVVNCLIIATSCVNKIDSNYVDPYQNDNIDWLFESYSITPLETTDNCLISEISKIKLYNDKYYILDGKKAILVFDKNGMFLGKVSHVGRGHGEYIEISSFDVHQDNIYVLSRSSQSINIYSENGTFMNKIELNDYYCDMITTDHSIVLSSNYSNNTLKNFVEIAYDGRVLKEWDDFKVNISYSSGNNSFCHTDDGFFYFKPFDHTIYKYTNSEHSIFAHYSFKSKEKYSLSNTKDIMYMAENTKNKEYVRCFESVGLIDSTLLILYPMYLEEYGICNFLLIDKLDDNTIYNYCISTEGIPSAPFVGQNLIISDNMLVGTMPAFVAKDIASHTGLTNPEIQNLNETDNPIIICHHLSL